MKTPHRADENRARGKRSAWHARFIRCVRCRILHGADEASPTIWGLPQVVVVAVPYIIVTILNMEELILDIVRALRERPDLDARGLTRIINAHSNRLDGDVRF